MAITKNEQLEIIRRLAQEITESDDLDRTKIIEINNLAWSYDPLEIKRKEMMRWFEKYEKFKQLSKKQEALKGIKSALANLMTTAFYCKDV
jgi:hypothetical protein